MSPVVESLVRSKKCGGIYRKAILMALASRCNDDGTGAYPSKKRMADEIECSRQTVHDTLAQLTAEGFLKLAGYVHTGHGKVQRYNLHLPKIMCLEEAITPKRPDLDTSPKTEPTVQNQAPNCLDMDSAVPKSEQGSVHLGDTKKDNPSSFLPSADERRAIVDRILAACGPGLADPARAPGVLLTLTRRLSIWLDSWDLEQDILPVVAAKTAKPRTSPLRNFELLETDIASHHAARTRPLPKLEIINEGPVQGRGARAAHSGGSGSGRYANGAGSSRSGHEPRSGNLAAAAARSRAMREDAAALSDEPEDWGNDGLAGSGERYGAYPGS